MVQGWENWMVLGKKLGTHGAWLLVGARVTHGMACGRHDGHIA